MREGKWTGREGYVGRGGVRVGRGRIDRGRGVWLKITFTHQTHTHTQPRIYTSICSEFYSSSSSSSSLPPPSLTFFPPLSPSVLLYILLHTLLLFLFHLFILSFDLSHISLSILFYWLIFFFLFFFTSLCQFVSRGDQPLKPGSPWMDWQPDRPLWRFNPSVSPSFGLWWTRRGVTMVRCCDAIQFYLCIVCRDTCR